MFKILIIFIIGTCSALKCHVCDNFDTANCFNIENAENEFLTECAKNETRCALLEEKIADPAIIRKCVKPTWSCDKSKYKCQTCNTDGCNNEKEVKIPVELELPNADLLMSNIHVVAVIGILLLLTVIWCLIRLCSKKNDVEYEEDDCDEYYENETNIDLDDEDDRHIQIIRKA